MRMRRLVSLAVFLLLLGGVGAVPAQEPGPPGDAEEQDQGDLQWPRVIEDGDVTYTVYQPQIDKFEDGILEARAAVQVETKTDDDKKTRTSYGVVWIKANTTIDKENSLVQLDDIQLPKANFPTAGDKADEYLETLRRNAEGARTISL